MIGLMLNRVRDATRLALSYVARDEYEYERPVLMQFVRHLQAFPLAYKHHFVTEGSLEADLRVGRQPWRVFHHLALRVVPCFGVSVTW